MASFVTPPVPGPGMDSQTSGQQAPSGPSVDSLMAGQEQPQQNQSPDKAEEMKAFMKKCRDMDQELQDHSRQFPEFSQAAKVAREAIGRGMQKVVAAMGRGSDAPAPQVPY